LPGRYVDHLPPSNTEVKELHFPTHHTPTWRGQGQRYLFVVYLDSVTAVFGIPRSATRYATTFGRKKFIGLKSSTGMSKFDIVLISSFLTFLLPYFVFK